MIGITTHPYHVATGSSEKPKKKVKISKKRKRITRAKASSPGIPPNTCPYIDLVITAVKDISEAYDKSYTKGEANPMVPKIEEVAIDLLEYIRTNNETLRDNSHYWYTKYKNNI